MINMQNSLRTFGRRTLSQSRLLSKVKLTADKYQISRGDYATISETDRTELLSMVNGKGLEGIENLDGYNTDWMNTVRGQSSLVLRPQTTEQMSKILKYCNENKIAVNPQGGNTGLVGGSNPVFDEVIISTSLMNQVEDVDPVSGILVAQAGCVLDDLNQKLSDYKLMMPLDLGAKGSCQLGGNLSTNAGGLRLLRYGSLRGTVLGVEAVLADGTIIDALQTLRKDNTGYDLKQLFLGSEGTLGIITKASILCAPLPNSVNVAYVSLETFDHVREVFKAARSQLGEILSAFEFVDEDCLDTLKDNLSLEPPVDKTPFTVVIETHGSNRDHDQEKLELFLEYLMENEMIVNGTVAEDSKKVGDIWQLRERMAEALQHDGYVYKYDVSIPLKHFYDLVEDMRERLGDKALRCVGYGHVGDSNLHLNVTTSEYSEEVNNLIEPFIYEWVASKRGSISAEHGIGFKKTNYLHFSKSNEAIDQMKLLKNLFDPNNILNPYKVLPQ